MVVHLEGRIFVCLGATFCHGLAAHAAASFPCVGVHTAAMALEFTMFLEYHLYPQPQHQQGYSGKGAKQCI